MNKSRNYIKKTMAQKNNYNLYILNRKIKRERMLEYVGNEVVELKRVSIGNLSLDEKLELGEYREITNTELEEIFK